MNLSNQIRPIGPGRSVVDRFTPPSLRIHLEANSNIRILAIT